MQPSFLRITGTQDTHYHLTFEFSGAALPIKVTSADTALQISNFRSRYINSLYLARKALGNASPVCDAQRALRFLDEVHRLGCELLFKLAYKKLHELTSRINEALEQKQCLEPPTALAPVIEVDAPGMFFPLEILPLLGTSWPEFDAKVEPADLFHCARLFVGMSAVVRRLGDPDDRLDQDNVLVSKPRLPIKFFHHASLPGAGEELNFFRTKADQVALQGPWPFDEPEAPPKPVGFLGRLWGAKPAEPAVDPEEQRARDRKLADDMTGFLMAPHRRFDGTEHSPPDQILHFSCHCGRAAEPGDYSLQLKSTANKSFAVRIGDIQGLIVRKRAPAVGAKVPSFPLVFLNACASGVTQAYDFASFESLFAATKHRGLIATQTAVPDRFASRFAELFYHSLFRYQTVGQSLHEARWEMLHLYSNPLGLLYNVYGNPDLQIEDPYAGRAAG